MRLRFMCLQRYRMNRNEIPAYAQELVKLAKENGAVEAVPFVLSDIVFDERTLIKCMFGCSDWGKGLTCPSREGFPDLPTWKRMLSNYKWGIIIHAHSKAPSQRASMMLEGRAFRDGQREVAGGEFGDLLPPRPFA